MVETIPPWLLALDARKPYREVIDGERQPDVSPKHYHGILAVRIAAQLDAWAEGRGSVGAEIRFYFQSSDGTWTSLLPDVAYLSAARFPLDLSDEAQRPRAAPDIAVEIRSPADRSPRIAAKVATYLSFGSTVVVVLEPEARCVDLHRAGGTLERRAARGTWTLAPFAELVFDWERIYCDLGFP